MPALQVSPIVAALDRPDVAALNRDTVPKVALSLCRGPRIRNCGRVVSSWA